MTFETHVAFDIHDSYSNCLIGLRISYQYIHCVFTQLCVGTSFDVVGSINVLLT